MIPAILGFYAGVFAACSFWLGHGTLNHPEAVRAPKSWLLLDVGLAAVWPFWFVIWLIVGRKGSDPK